MARFPSALLFVVGIGCLCGLNVTRPAAAVVPEAKSATATRIALIDMAQVFKRSIYFEARRDALKLKIADSEADAKIMRARILQETKRLERLETGLDERRQVEPELKRLQAEFESYRKTKSGEFLREESQIYREVYRTVSNAVAAYAASHEIDLVMRFSNTDMDANMEPKQLLESMNRQVIYENHLDITEEIIAIVNEK